ncbi:hypothetical protein B0O99DRAFT_694610 [Bisporella sp. PMI_857]|nr:hypothetical protein B0O99DRAFT_694610 [Bisporella sp. PMI_857]
MITVAEIISQLSLCDKTLTVEELVGKPGIISLLSKAFNSLTPKSKTAVQNLFSRATNGSKKKAKKNHYLKTILQTGKIALPAEVNEQFAACKENPSVFWNRGHWLHSKSATQDSRQHTIHVAVAQAYLGVKELSIQRKWDTIVWRFYTLFFYELALLLGDGGVQLTATLFDRLLEVLTASSRISDNSETITKNLNKWFTAGSKYSKFCDSLGAGALFLLPHLTDNTWEDKSMTGMTYEKAIDHLINCEIRELSDSLGANNVATKIRAAALEPFRWNVNQFRWGERLYNGNTSGPATQIVDFVPDRQEPSGIQRKGLEGGAPGDSPVEAVISAPSAPVDGVPQDSRTPIDILYEAAVQAEQVSSKQIHQSILPTAHDQFNIPNPDQNPTLALGQTGVTDSTLQQLVPGRALEGK